MVKKFIAFAVILVMAISTSVVAQSVQPEFLFGCINQDFDEARYEAFGTIDPIEIGQAVHTAFMVDFVNNRNEQILAINATHIARIRLENSNWIVSNVLYSSERSIAMQSSFDVFQPLNFTTCWHCGTSAPTVISPGDWGRTGASRPAGVWPNQFFENEESRRVTVSAICPNWATCGRTLHSSHFYEFRWVRA